MRCCEECGRIFAPSRAPAACPECAGPLAVRPAAEAARLARRRLAEQRRRHRLRVDARHAPR